MAQSEDEEDIGMYRAHRALLERSIGDLANMDPKEVITQLRRRGLLDDQDCQAINDPLIFLTDSEKNTKIIDKLKGRGPTAFDTFFQILNSINANSAEKVLPVQHRILWFTSSPRYAAAVTYSLETHFDASVDVTLKTERHGSYLLYRRRIFKRNIPSEILNSDSDRDCDLVRLAQDVELCLAFPISERGDTPQKALSEVFKDLGSKVTVAILSGVCEGVRGDSGEELGVRGGDVVLATEAVSVDGRKRELPLSSALTEAKAHLSELPENNQKWFEEAKKKLKELEQADIIPIREHPRFVPHFDTIHQHIQATPTTARLPRALASDSDTFPFYDLCACHLGMQRPWFSCKGVISHAMLNNVDPSREAESVCALMSTFFAIEACKIIVEKLRQSSRTFNTRSE